ncbi:MAG: cyclic pyranopterin monophosphate synthase MoaC [Bacteroidia bacterium]|nr:cyclic pyranopterin monophosphate synthase MoaC [Bacteroidia bacterium]
MEVFVWPLNQKIEPMEDKFTHLDESGNPGMVDVGHKADSQRLARASARVWLGKEIMSQLKGDEIQSPKGPVFQTAIIAGTMAAKKTHDLIPLCHPLPVTGIKFRIEAMNEDEVYIECRAKVSGKTGVEMEALTGASVAALTIYDMCKAFSQEMVIKEIKLMEKLGGKTDFKRD